MSDTTPNKVCRNCQETKDVKDFYKTKNKAYIDNLLHWCKKCISKYRKEKRVCAPKATFMIEKKEIVFSFD
jgi:hypothetical protein